MSSQPSARLRPSNARNRGRPRSPSCSKRRGTPETPIIVERVVNDIDGIVRVVRFDGWQSTHAGEREVKLALRKTLFKYRLHQDQELFDRAYGYIREYY
jgi:type I restriction enzyme R subunit